MDMSPTIRNKRDLFMLGVTDEVAEYFSVKGPYRDHREQMEILFLDFSWPADEVFIADSTGISVLEMKRIRPNHLNRVIYLRGRESAKGVVQLLVDSVVWRREVERKLWVRMGLATENFFQNLLDKARNSCIIVRRAIAIAFATAIAILKRETHDDPDPQDT